MSYQNGYGYNARFHGAYPAQGGAGAFYGGAGQMTPPQFQNAQTTLHGQIQGAFSVQPVTSREEALAVIADPMSPGVLLPDLAHGAVYIKRFNPNTGISDFGEFRLTQPTPPEAPPEYVTRTDLEAALTQFRAELTSRPGKAKKEAADE